MAMVLDAFASYLGDLLKQVAEEDLGMMMGVSGDIDKMGVKLGDLKNLLADADRRRITDASVQAWVTELKRAMYEATDILDLCQLKIMERGMSTPDVGCCNPLLFCLRNPRFAHEIGDRIKKLNQSLDDIKERSAAFSFLNLTSYEDRRMARPSAAHRKTDPVLERSSVVGEKIEVDTRVLVEKLRNKNGIDGIMVFAIVGVSGIGKTTLAKKVFNDEAIEHGFNTKIWLSITKVFNDAELLKTAIVAAKGILPKGGTQDKSLLMPALESAMRDKKFFLVLDDMWGDNEWNNLLKAPFSYGAPGSRVLLTTRLEIVARGMKAVHPYHHVDKLEPEDAWSLLKKQVKCFFLWVDVLAKTLMNELLEEHEEWLPILPRTTAAAARAPEEETEGGARNDREVVVELRRLNQKIRKLEDQAQIPIWAFVGMVIALGVMLKLYGKA